MKSVKRRVEVNFIEPKRLAVLIAELLGTRPPAVLSSRKLTVGDDPKARARAFDRIHPRDLPAVKAAIEQGAVIERKIR